MPIPRQALEEAAFWDRLVCLSCASIVEGTETNLCEICGSEDILAAKTVLRCAEILKEPEE